MPIVGPSSKQVDFNGKMLTSMGIYPNPNGGKYQVEVSNMHEQGKLVIYDVFGRKVMQEEVSASNSQLIGIDMTSHEIGTYVIRLVYGEKQIIKKLVMR